MPALYVEDLAVGIGLTFPFMSFSDMMQLTIAELFLWNFKAIDHNKAIEEARNAKTTK